jgi:hypothetical protein
MKRRLPANRAELVGLADALPVSGRLRRARAQIPGRRRGEGETTEDAHFGSRTGGARNQP